MTQRFQNFIGGRWCDAQAGATFSRANPADGSPTGDYPQSSAADVDAAVRAACTARDAWRRTPAPRRGEILFRAAEILVRDKEPFARALTEEMGKVLKEGRGDIQEAIDMTYYMAGEGRRTFGQTTPSELPDKWAMSVRAPVGVVACVTPWNFPMAIPSWKIMPAIITGNTVVFKPSQFAPKSALHLVQALEQAGLPAGVVNLVFGEGATAGTALIEHPGVDLVSFTGSNAVGRQIAIRCAELGKPVSLEMGGKNAITVLDDADIGLAVDGAVWSAFGTTGQRCTAASRIIVHRDVYDEFAARFVERAKSLRLGDGLDDATDVGPVVNTSQLDKIASYMEVGRGEGATLACGGQVVRDGALAQGHFFAPTVFTDATPQMRIAQEEIFGPVTALIPVAGLDAAIEVNNGVTYGLSSSIYTQDVNRAFRAIERLNTGLVYVNAGTIGAEVHLPFGGTRGTGNGHREAGIAALETFTEWKSVYVDYSGKLQKAQIDVP
ncbi:MAG: aldehyde dehydrogenase family protein [Chloroflexi bacterium]|nr:aldehyde dehydrogenase family protein [Chloroflexota bacterium]